MTSLPYLAPLYALCSAFLFALSNHFTHFGLEGTDARSGTLVSIAASAAIYWLLSPVFVESWYWLTTACLLFALVGIIRPSLSSVLATTSIQVMGPTLTSALTAATPLFGAFFAIVFLGERLTLPIAIGTLAVMAGAVVGAWSPQGVKRSWPLWAIVLPLGASLIRSLGHVGTKTGLIEVPSASFAVMISNTVSFGVGLLAFKLQSRPFSGTRQSHVWFIAAGAANALSLQFLNSALQAGDLVTVMPIVSATPIFTMLMGLLGFGRETITQRTLISIALIVPGVMLVTLAGRL
jgi:uncharacterized membrane protein